MRSGAGNDTGLRRWRRPRMCVWAAAVAVPLAMLPGAGTAVAATVAQQPTHGLVISKIAEPDVFTGPGEHITYHYTVTNDSRRRVLLPVVVDSQFGVVRCRTGLLRPGAETTCGPRTITTTSTNVRRRVIVNTAFARALGGVTSATVRVTVRRSKPNTDCEVENDESGQCYTDLQDAVNGAPAGSTLSVTGTVEGTTTIDRDLTLTGHDGATLNGEHEGTVLTIANGASVTLDSMTVTNGSAEKGGGIHIAGLARSTEGTLTLDDSTVVGNTATGDGGGIFSDATVNMFGNTTVGNNSASNGGGIWSADTVTMHGHSHVSGNHANVNGAGIFNSAGTVTMLDGSRIGSPNIAGNDGGGIYNFHGTVSMERFTIIQSNSAHQGGGIWSLQGHLVGAEEDVNVLRNHPDNIVLAT